MASQLYPAARQLFLTAQLSWLVGTYKAVLLPESYVPDFDDAFLSDVFEGVRIKISDALENKTAVSGIAGCDPIAFGIIVDNRRASKMIIFKDTGDEGTSNLVAFLDEESMLGVPLDLIGLEYFFVPSALEGGLFRL